MKIFFKSRLIFLFAVFISLVLISCSKDEPLSPAEEHFEAEGMVFYKSGIKILEIFRGVTQDTFFVPLGNITPVIEIKFLSPERQIINPPDYKNKPLSWEISDTSKVAVFQNEAGSYEFKFQGKNSGISQIEFFILHEGHPDFRSGKIPIKVQ